MRQAWAAVGVVIGLATGCGQSPAPPAPVAAVNPLEHASAREAARVLAQRGDWAGAVVKYREALRGAPEDVQLHFALGSALSHLDRREEAIERFKWVVARGRATVPEVAAAREWLRQAGALEAAQPDPSAAPRAVAAVDAESTGRVAGKTAWPGTGHGSHVLTLQILLAGDDPATQGRTLGARTRLGEPYSLTAVPEGRYRLIAQVGPVRLWDTSVQVVAGKETVLDLTPDKSRVSPQDFPTRPGR
ncbi:MAG: tetratricopeptide repeat protein [Candidatus Rokuibacteriota bacterium]